MDAIPFSDCNHKIYNNLQSFCSLLLQRMLIQRTWSSHWAVRSMNAKAEENHKRAKEKTRKKNTKNHRIATQMTCVCVWCVCLWVFMSFSILSIANHIELRVLLLMITLNSTDLLVRIISARISLCIFAGYLSSCNQTPCGFIFPLLSRSPPFTLSLSLLSLHRVETL